MKAVVSEKGQVTIPKKLRERMGISPGQILEFEEDHGKLVARKAPRSDVEKALDEYYGYLKDEWPGYTSDMMIEELRGPILPGDLPDSRER